MNKILNIKQAIKLADDLRKQNKTIVLVGGCFDILHAGHIHFLEKAKEKGDILFLLLEDDETVQKMKGDDRPINNQTDRALILSALYMLDYVVLLPPLPQDIDYDAIIAGIKPDIIATTKGDPNRSHKERQAEKVYATILDVTPRIIDKSTSRLATVLFEKFDL